MRATRFFVRMLSKWAVDKVHITYPVPPTFIRELVHNAPQFCRGELCIAFSFELSRASRIIERYF